MLSERVKQIRPSYTLEMTKIASSLRKNGIDVIDLGVGEPDFNTPVSIRNAAKEAMDRGFTKYTPGAGIIELKEAICKKLQRDNGLEYSPDQIIVSNGAKHSLSTACQALFNRGDEVIVFSPYWVSFPEFVCLADATPVIINTLGDNFEPDWDELTQKLNSKTKGIIINSPSNPTGAVWGKHVILRILELAVKHNSVVISDECYEQLVYDETFVSTEKLNSIGANVITIQSLSKTYAMTGWRIGYCAGNPEIIRGMDKIQSQMTSCPNSIAQRASVEALLGDQTVVKEMVEIFKQRRDAMVDRLRAIPNTHCSKPKGAFYTFPDFSYYMNKIGGEKKISTSFDLCDYILRTKQVVTVAGSGFGKDGFIRLSFATSKEIFLKGIDFIEEALTNLK